MAPKKKEDRHHKIHQRQFGDFLQYLKEHDAIIEIKEGKEGHKTTYTANPYDGNPNITDILLGPLGFKKYEVDDYYRNVPLRKNHSAGNRKVEIGNVIESITIYLESDGRVDKAKNTLEDSIKNPLGVRSTHAADHELRTGQIIYQSDDNVWVEKDLYSDENKEDLISNRYFGNEFKVLTSDILSSIDSMIPVNFSKIENYSKMISGGKGYQFRVLLESLKEIYDLNSKDYSESSKNELTKWLVKTKDFYDNFVKNGETNTEIIPGYKDFMLITNPHKTGMYKDFKNLLTNDEHSIESISFEDALNNRYEILTAWKDLQIPMSECTPRIHALVVLTYLEYFYRRYFEDECAEKLKDDFRFIVYTSSSGGKLNYQEDSFTLEELSRLLTEYNFRGNLDDLFKVDGINLKFDRLIKYPESAGAKGHYTEGQIYEHINRQLYKYARTRLKEALFINNKY